MVFEDLVVDGHHGRKLAEPTAFGRGQAEQGDDFGKIGVQAEILFVAIGPCIGVILGVVHHMAQSVAHHRLRNTNTHVGADAPINQAEVFFVVPI